MIVQEPVQAAVWHCLNHYAYSDAVFLAERLYDEVESDENLYLLATSYYRSGRINQAYFLLKDKSRTLHHPQCRYLLACCANHLNKYAEVERILCGDFSASQCNLDDIISEFGDAASFALQLLARICAKTERGTIAAEAFRKSLKLNPFLWTSFTDLCDRGEKPDPEQTFRILNIEDLSTCQGSNPALYYIDSNVSAHAQHLICESDVEGTPDNPILQTCNPPILNKKINGPSDSPVFVKPALRCRMPHYKSLFSNSVDLSPLTQSFGILPLENVGQDDSLDVISMATPTGPPLSESNDQKSLAKRVRAHVGQIIGRPGKPVFSQTGNITPMTPAVRRSSRLFSNGYSVKENNKSPNRGKGVAPKSPSRKMKQRQVKMKPTFDLNAKNLRTDREKTETITSVESDTKLNTTHYRYLTENILSLLRELGQSYRRLSSYECSRTITTLDNLPPRHRNSSWALILRAKALFELPDYAAAVRAFSEARTLDPARLDGLELYSTALWHLQRETQLSALAQELVELDRNSPVSWCAAGNCFSLHKEHDAAVKMFHRAVQVDPSFAYAYTLLGHEYVATEELDKAMSCFRNAVRLDPRHYNAWFGIGTIYSKQERFELAEVHYRRALSVNPRSSVLLCHLGVVQHARKQTDRALRTLDQAIASNPNNPLCKFHRGSIYFAAGRHAEALAELEELRRIVPKESLVYYLIGKVHKKLGNTHLALMHFSWATDLDPKGASSLVKEAFEPATSRSQVEEETDGPQTPPPHLLHDQVYNALPEDSDDSL